MQNIIQILLSGLCCTVVELSSHILLLRNGNELVKRVGLINVNQQNGWKTKVLKNETGWKMRRLQEPIIIIIITLFTEGLYILYRLICPVMSPQGHCLLVM